MITNVEYMQIVSEAYDLSDYATKKKVLFCNEAKKVDNIEHIVSSLYLNIKNNVAGIDFGTIPRSRGIVTRIENYADLCECINSVHELVVAYKERTDVIDEISTCLANIQQRERVFSKAFALNIEFPIMMYNMAVLSVVSSVSLLLAGTIEYVKNGHDSYTVSFDKVGYNKSRERVLYEFILQFNRNCDNGTLDKLMDACMKNNLTTLDESAINEDNIEGILEAGEYDGIVLEGILGAEVLRGFKNAKSAADIAKSVGSAIWKTKIGKFALIVIGAGAMAIALLQTIRWAAFHILKFQMKVSDWFEIQAQYLQINAENLKYREDDKGDDHRREVYQNQMKWVDRFKRLANFFAIKDTKVSKETNNERQSSRNQTYTDDEDDGGLF